MTEPRFLILAEVLYLHDESLARFGGMAGIGDPGLVESALGSAQNAYWYGKGGLTHDGSVYQAMIDIAKKRLDKPGLAMVLKKLAESRT